MRACDWVDGPVLGPRSWHDHRCPDTAAQPRWKIIGPGLVVAATGVGAADLVATLVAGSKYGYALLWCAVLGCLMKIVLVEGAGRYSLATGRTIFEGWQTLGIWTTWYFGIYVVVWGFVYGAAAMAGTGLPLHSLFPFLEREVVGDPQRPDRPGAGVVRPVRLFEKVCTALVGPDVRLDGRGGGADRAEPARPDGRAGPEDPPTAASSTCSAWPAASAARSLWRRTATGCGRRAGRLRSSCG